MTRDSGALPSRSTPALQRESATGRYLGYPIHITEHEVTVYRPDGRHIATVPSISTARRVIRGYRRGSAGR